MLSQIVSASQAGDIQFLDVRRASEPYLTIEAHRGSLTALAIHRHAPVVASGSAMQMIKVFSLEGEQLTKIRYQPSFMGQTIGSVNCLSFHPYKSLLAAGTGDNAHLYLRRGKLEDGLHLVTCNHNAIGRPYVLADGGSTPWSSYKIPDDVKAL